MNEYNLKKFIDDEIADGATMEDVLELFNLTPGDVFVHLFNHGMIDEDLLHSYVLDI